MKRLAPLFLILFIASCSTDTGNPVTKSRDRDEINSRSFAQFIVKRTCAKLTACHEELSPADCTQYLFALNTLNEKFGVTNKDMNDFDAVYRSELSGALKVNVDEGVACGQEIRWILCNDARVVNAYRPDLPNPLQMADRIFGPICQRVYKTP